MQKSLFDRYEEVVINVLWFWPAKLRKSSKIALILMIIWAMREASSKAKNRKYPAHLSRMFKKETGTPPSDYILSRISKKQFKYSKEVQISMLFGNLNSLSAFALVVFAISSNGLLSELATNAAV